MKIKIILLTLLLIVMIGCIPAQEQENIVEHLFACKESNHSPFGKPTFISMATEDIDKKFEL